MPIEKPILLDVPMPIMTPRLRIEPVHPKYAYLLHEAKAESLDILKPWMSWADKLPSIEEEKEWMTRKYAEFILRENLTMLAFNHDDQLVMGTGIHALDWHTPMGMIGYWCRKSAQGKGYVTEASNALLRYGFEVLGLRKMSIDMDSENIKSENVAKRLNLTKEFEQMGGLRTLHEDTMRKRLSYCCFDTKDLPTLDVSW